MRSGFVYILSNPSMPGLIKIGYTNGSVYERAAQLNTTGVPFPYVIEYSQRVINAGKVEKELHNKFRQHRLSKNREFFELPAHEAISELMSYPVFTTEMEKKIAEKVAEDERQKKLSRQREISSLKELYSDVWDSISDIDSINTVYLIKEACIQKRRDNYEKECKKIYDKYRDKTDFSLDGVTLFWMAILFWFVFFLLVTNWIPRANFWMRCFFACMPAQLLCGVVRSFIEFRKNGPYEKKRDEEISALKNKMMGSD